MQSALRRQTIVQSGGLIQISAPELLAGTKTEVIILVEEEKQEAKPQEAVDKALMAAGLMLAPPVGIDADAYHAFQPVRVVGKPVSETILEERR